MANAGVDLRFTLDWLPPRRGVVFGLLSISGGLDEGEPWHSWPMAATALLCPWRWQNVSFKGGQSYEVRGEPPSARWWQPASKEDDWNKTLDDLKEDLEFQLHDLLPPGSTLPMPDEARRRYWALRQVDADNDSKPLIRQDGGSWGLLLQQLAREPGQLGRHLGVVYLVRHPNNGVPFLPRLPIPLAPSFTIDVSGNEFTLEPEPLAQKDVANHEHPSVAYKIKNKAGEETQLPGIGEVKAKLAVTYGMRRADEQNDHPYLEASSLWVHLPETHSWGGKNWLPELPYDIAGVADLPQRLAEAIDGWADANPDAVVDDAMATALKFSFDSAQAWASWIGLADAPPKYKTNEKIEPKELPPLRETADDLLFRFKGSQTEGELAEQSDDAVERLIEELRGFPQPERAKAILNEELLKLWPKAKATNEGDGATAAAIPLAPPKGLTRRAFARTIRQVTTTAGSSEVVARLWRRLLEDRLQGVKDQGSDSATTAEAFLERMDDLEEKLASKLPLRQRLAIDRLSAPGLNFWATLLGQPANVDQIKIMRNETKGKIENIWETTITEPLNNEIKKNEILKGKIPDTFTKDLSSWAESAIVDQLRHIGPEEVLDDGHEDAALFNAQLGRREPVPAPHPLSIVAGDLRPVTGLEQDRIAGLLVLMRQKSKEGLTQQTCNTDPRCWDRWYCLTMAALRYESDAAPEELKGRTLAVGVSPWRIVTQAGLESWTVAYDGLPITARSILAEGAGDIKMEAEKTTDLLSNPLKAYQVEETEGCGAPNSRCDLKDAGYDAATNGDWAKLISLKYGQTYELAFAGVTNSGALPQEISDPQDPTLLKLPADFETDAGKNHQRKMTVRYLRRTQVGAPMLVRVEQEALKAIRKKGESDSELDPERLVLPKIEREGKNRVFPRAEEMLGDEALGSSTADQVQPRPAADLGPLVLLVPDDKERWRMGPKAGRSSWSFGVRPPTVDLDDYLRWRQMDHHLEKTDAIQEEIIAVLATWQQKAPPPIESESKEENPHEHLIPDPAVVRIGFVVDEIKQIGGEIKYQRKNSFYVDCPGLKVPGNALEKEDPLRIEVSIPEGELSEPELWSKGKKLPAGEDVSAKDVEEWKDVNWNDGLELRVPEGRIFRLQVLALTKFEWVEGLPDDPGSKARFRVLQPLSGQGQDCTIPGSSDCLPPLEIEREWDDHVILSRTPLTVETATTDMPSEKQLWSSIQVLASDGQSLMVGIDPAATASIDSNQMDHVKQVTLMRQMWRWTGRKLSEHLPLGNIGWEPREIWALQPGGAAWQRLSRWDIEAFGDRAENNSLATSGLLPRPVREGNVLPVSRGTVLHELDLSRDPRAQYWRYAAYATSRYAGLMKPGENENGSRGFRSTPWRRLLIKARPTQRLPKPKLRFVLPLTQATISNASTEVAPLLVVLEQAWTGLSGYGERLETHLELATNDNNLASIPKTRPQYGFDPLETAQDALPGVPDNEAAKELASFATDDPPFALTLDLQEGIDMPFPSATCFEITPTGEKIAPHAFAKLRFRMRLSDGATAGNADDFASEFTEGGWVQLLPDAGIWRYIKVGSEQAKGGKGRSRSEGTIKPHELAFDDEGILRRWSGIGTSRQTAGAAVRILPSLGATTVTSDADPMPFMRRAVYVALTNPISHADGRRDSEQWIDLHLIEGDQPNAKFKLPDKYFPETASDEEDANGGTNMRARLIEVAFRDPERSAGDPEWKNWRDLSKALFPATGDENQEATTDAKARVVRVSPPLAAVSRKSRRRDRNQQQ